MGEELGAFDAFDGLVSGPHADADSVALLVGDGDLSMVVAIIDGLCVRTLSDELLVGNALPFNSDGGAGI